VLHAKLEIRVGDSFQRFHERVDLLDLLPLDRRDVGDLLLRAVVEELLAESG